MQQPNLLSPRITSTHLDPPLISPVLSIDDNAPSTKITKGIKESSPRTINLCLLNGLYGYPFSKCGSIYTTIPSLNCHKRDCPHNLKNKDFKVPSTLKHKVVLIMRPLYRV